MAKGEWKGHSIGMGDVMKYMKDLEEEYAVKVRLSVVPRPSSGYKQGGIVLVTPYHPNGRKMAHIEAQQHLWPTSAFKTIEGCWMYLLHQLSNALAEEEEHIAKVREEERKDTLTPLEDYIANSFPS